MDRNKKIYFGILLIVIFLISTMFFSYAFFTSKTEGSGKLNIVAGDLDYKLVSNDLKDNKITVDAYTVKEINIKLTSLNDIDSKYELYYTLDKANSDVSVGYSKDTQNSVLGTIKANSSKNINIVIRNDSSSSTTVTFGVVGGLINNDLVLSTGNSLNQEVRGQNIVVANNNLITTKANFSLPAGPITTSNDYVYDESGLYMSTETNSGKPTYYFRGDVENNYVDFVGLTWRIVRINEDGTIRLILQNPINNKTYYEYSLCHDSYSCAYYTNSTVKTELETWYDANLSTYDDKIASGDYFCEEAKVVKNSGYLKTSFGAAEMITIAEYNSSVNFKCSQDGNGYGLVNAKIGLITYDEFIHAGASLSRTFPTRYGYFVSDANYYLKLGGGYYIWTMSPAGMGIYDQSTVWKMLGSGGLAPNTTHFDDSGDRGALNPVINLKADVTLTGSGLSDDPYKVS